MRGHQVWLQMYKIQMSHALNLHDFITSSSSSGLTAKACFWHHYAHMLLQQLYKGRKNLLPTKQIFFCLAADDGFSLNYLLLVSSKVAQFCGEGKNYWCIVCHCNWEIEKLKVQIFPIGFHFWGHNHFSCTRPKNLICNKTRDARCHAAFHKVWN